MTDPLSSKQSVLVSLEGAAFYGEQNPDGISRISAQVLRDAIRLIRSSDETGEKRAYYETHDPPHCPTCGCGLPRADACSCGRAELKDGYVRATCADGSVHTKGGCNSPSKASDECICLSPFDTKPGSHHSLKCPRYTP